MHEPNGRGNARQRWLDQHFEARAQKWKDLYENEDPRGRRVRGRLERAVWLTRQVQLKEGAGALDVGCGTGVMATQLASRGFQVAALDTVPRMLQLTRERAMSDGLQGSIFPTLGDARRLPFSSQTFDLVVALGLISWLETPLSALSEIARVCRFTGYAVISCANLFRAESLLDPRHTPLLDSVKRPIKTKLKGTRWEADRDAERRPQWHKSWYSPGRFDSMLSSVGFAKVAACTYGFGPPRFFGKRLVPERLALGIHERLQALADAEVPLLKRGGLSYIVLAQKVVIQEGSE